MDYIKNNFYKSGRGLTFFANPVHENSGDLSSTTVRQLARRNLETHPKEKRTALEETRHFFARFLGKLKARIKYRCSKDVVPFTQRLHKITEVPLMYRECTGSVPKRYWRSTTDPLNACTSGVDRQYSKSRKVVAVEAMKNKSMPFVLALICFMLFNLSDAWAQSAESRTAEGQIEIKPLKMGDTIPEELWNLPLQVVNHPDGKDTITLNDFRDKKLIILDFWATWCGSCIASMPYMHELETEMTAQVKLLPVTFQDKKTIRDFLNKSVSPNITSIRSAFSSIVNGRALDSYFPSRSIPHVVIIDASGKVRAIAVPSAINVRNLEEMIANGELEPIRQRIQTVDSPLLNDDAGTGGIYYSAFLPYSAAIPFTTSFRADSAKGHAHYYSLNTRLIKLFGHAVFVGDENVKHTGIHLLPSRRILEVADPALYDQNNNEYPLEKVMFTYESVMPFKTTITEAKRKMKSDLEFQFGLQAGLKTIKVPCLVLTVSDTSRIPYAENSLQRKLVRKGVTVLNGGYEVFDRPVRNRSSSYLQNYPIAQLVYMLNKLADGKTPFVIDETGIRKNLDLDIVDDLSDFGQLQKALLLQGIKIEKQEREQVMFVLKDPNYRRPSTQLELTPSGYVYLKKEGGDL